MTAHDPRRRMPRRLGLAAVIALALLAAGCGGSSSSHSPAGSPQSSGATRETAEKRLQIISTELGTVLTDYKNGKTQEAYTLAKSITANLYEGTTEGLVSQIDPADDRPLDSLLAATLPAAIHSGEPASQIASLTHRAQALASRCLDAIRHTE